MTTTIALCTITIKPTLRFKLTENSQASLKEIFENVLVEIFTTNDYVNKLVKFNDINYMVTKTAIRVVEQIIGYSLRFSTETDIKNLEIDLNKQLMKRGFVAKYSFDDIIYKSEIMERTVKLAKQVALTDYTILINGESGTGKELFAQGGADVFLNSLGNQSKRSPVLHRAQIP